MSSKDSVVHILREQFWQADKVLCGEHTLAAMGLDDLDQVELIMEVEELFGVSLPDEEFELHQETMTLDQFVSIVDRYLPSATVV